MTLWCWEQGSSWDPQQGPYYYSCGNDWNERALRALSLSREHADLPWDEYDDGRNADFHDKWLQLASTFYPQPDTPDWYRCHGASSLPGWLECSPRVSPVSTAELACPVRPRKSNRRWRGRRPRHLRYPVARVWPDSGRCRQDPGTDTGTCALKCSVSSSAVGSQPMLREGRYRRCVTARLLLRSTAHLCHDQGIDNHVLV